MADTTRRNREQSARIIEKVLLIGREQMGTLFSASVADILTEEKPDAATLLDAMSRVTLTMPGDHLTALSRTREVMLPFLHVQIAAEQIEEQRKLSRSNFRLTVAALILAAVQAAGAGVGIYQIFAPKADHPTSTSARAPVSSPAAQEGNPN